MTIQNQARAYWAAQGRPWPSLMPVVVFTLLLGVFGVLVAYNEANKAAAWGASTTEYYAAWFITWISESMLLMALYLAFVAHMFGRL